MGLKVEFKGGGKGEEGEGEEDGQEGAQSSHSVEWLFSDDIDSEAG